MADDLSAQGSGLRARQTKGSPHAPEKLTPMPAVNLRVYIDFLAQGLEGTGRLSVSDAADDYYYYIGKRPKLEGDTENSGV